MTWSGQKQVERHLCTFAATKKGVQSSGIAESAISNHIGGRFE